MLSTAGVFIAVPLISLYAVDQFKLGVFEIGVLSAIWPGTVFCLSFFCGLMADKIGYLSSVRLGLMICSAAFVIATFASNIFQFGLGLFLFGLGKAFFDSSLRASLTRVCAPSEREKYFRWRYLLQNAACIVGPVIGVFAYKIMFQFAFSLTALFYALFLTLTYLFLNNADFKGEESHSTISFFQRFEVLRDERLLRWIGSGTLILIAFGAYEAFMPVIITQATVPRPPFGYLVSLNGATVVFAQLLHMRFLRHTPLKYSIFIGSAFMSLGYLLFCVEWNAYVSTIVATVIFSVGEAFLFPCFEVVMDRMAPKEKKAVYFGAGELKQVGFFLGPLAGGLLYEHLGFSALFIACAICIALAAALLNLTHQPSSHIKAV